MDQTPLWTAVTNNHVRVVRELIEAGADPNTVGKGAPAALHWAVTNGSLKLVDLLLEAGAEPNVALPKGRDTSFFEGSRPGTTPLMIAAREGKVELVDRLLEAGADWTRGDSQGNTAMSDLGPTSDCSPATCSVLR